MAVRRRKRSVRRNSRRRRIVNLKKFFGGYMESGNWVPQPLDRRYRIDMKKQFEADNPDRKIKKSDYLNWYKLADKWANRNVIDETAMNNIINKYRSGTDEEKKLAMESLHDQLVVRDIQKNPEDYIREWEKGKHRRNRWAKWAGGAAEIAAILGLAYAGTKFGPALAAKLFSKGSAGTAGTMGNAANTVAEGANTANTVAEGSKEIAEIYKGYAKDFSNSTLKDEYIKKLDTWTDNPFKKAGATLAEGPINSNPFDLTKYNNEGLVNSLVRNIFGKVSTKDNNGLVKMGAENVIVKGPGDLPLTLTHDQFHEYAMRNPNDFAGYMKLLKKAEEAIASYLKPPPEVPKQGWFDGVRNWFWGSGSRYRVTRKGRRLIRRYKRHLRHKRRKH